MGSGSELTIEVSEPVYDGFQELLDSEARAALAVGDYRRAWHFFWRLLLIDPLDTRAMRECGRLAHATGGFTYAADALGRVDELTGDRADPELHYLRGESLLALGRRAEGLRELAEAEREIGATPADRRHLLWLARIHALRRELPEALALYDDELARSVTDASYEEVTLLRIEAHALSQSWAAAERQLRTFLRDRSDHRRAQEMLAWVLEARGDYDEALALRAVLAAAWGDHARRTTEYARALERSREYPEALESLRAARALGARDLGLDISRLERRLAPEIAAGFVHRDDPSGTIDDRFAGASIPVSDHLRVALTASQVTSGGGLTAVEGQSQAATATALLDLRHGSLLGVGAIAHRSAAGATVGGTALARTSPRRTIQIHGKVEFHAPWRESASTLRRNGVYDAFASQLFAGPSTGRLLFAAGVQARRLWLRGDDAVEGPRATQLLGHVGLDVVPWQRPGRMVRAESLDEEMVAPRTLASSLVLSYRHYEMRSDNPFGEHLVLVERSSIDEASFVARHVMDAGGHVGAEARGGVGYDRERDVRIWRAGVSALLSVTASSRLSVDLDEASESGTGLTGRRRTAAVVLHVDL